MPPTLKGINKSRKHPVTIPVFRDNEVEHALPIGLGNIEGTNRPRRHPGRGHINPFSAPILIPVLHKMTTAIQNDIQGIPIAGRRQLPLRHRPG